MTERVLLEGRQISIPRIQGLKEVFGSPLFFFVKPRWTLDHDVLTCPLCYVTFTQLKRKHHCRNCGHIFCSKCCSRKVPLPQFGLDEPQRICDSCNDIVELVSKSRSSFIAHRQEGAVGFVKMMSTTDGQAKMIELGGLHTLISIVTQGDDVIKKAAAAGIHILAQHLTLHDTLVDMGCIKTVTQILTTLAVPNEETTLHALHALKLFSSNRNITNKDNHIRVFEQCKIAVLEKLLLSTGTTAVLAAGILCVLSENHDFHQYITEENPQLISRLVQSLSSEDVQMKETCLKTLVHFTAGSKECGEQILLEDIASDRPLMKFLDPKVLKAGYERIVGNTVCVIANLASNSEWQAKLQPYVSCLTLILEFCGKDLDAITLCNLSRGLANFSEYPVHALPLINRLPLILSTLMLSQVEILRIHTARLVVSLLTIEPVATLERLTENGAESFLETILALPGTSEMLINLLLRKGSRLSVSI